MTVTHKISLDLRSYNDKENSTMWDKATARHEN